MVHFGGIPSVAAFVIPKLLGLTFSLSRSTSDLSVFWKHSNGFTSSPTPVEAPELTHRRKLKHPWTTDQLRLLASLLPEKGPILWSQITETGAFDPPRSKGAIKTAYQKYIKGRSRAASSLADEESWLLDGGSDNVSRVAQKDIVRWTLEEDYILAKGAELYREKHWKEVAADLPGRSAIACSIRWSLYKEELTPWIVAEWDDVQKGVRALETLMTTLMREAPRKQGRKLTGVSLKSILNAAKADLPEKGDELPPQFLTTMMLRRFVYLVKFHTRVAKNNIRRYPEVSMHSPQESAIKFVADKSWRQYKTGKLEKLKHWKVYAAAESKPDPSVTKGGSYPAQKAKDQLKSKSSKGQIMKTTGKAVFAAPKVKVEKVDEPRKNSAY